MTDKSIIESNTDEVEMEQHVLDASAFGDYDTVPLLFRLNLSSEVDTFPVSIHSESPSLEVCRVCMDSDLPLQTTAAERNIKSVKDLIEHGAIAAATGDAAKLYELLSSGTSVEAEILKRSEISTVNDRTLLHVAATCGHTKCIEILINFGANLEARDKFGCTALHLASQNGHYVCLKLLLEARADCSVSIDMPFFYVETPYVRGTTALHLAAKYNHVKCVKELIRFGADCNVVDMNGHTSLYIAAKAGFSECVLTLLRKAHDKVIGSLSLPSYNSRNTPLYHAVENRMVECVKELVRLGSDVNHINNIGFSPLHRLCYTAKSGNDVDMEILKHLVLEGHNTDVNKTAVNGLTALFCATYSSHAPMAQFLITYGADINIKDNSGLTLLEYELSCKESLDILKSVVKCMPQLPHLKALNVAFPEITLHEGQTFIKKNAIWHGLKLSDNVKFWLVRTEGQVYIQMFNNQTCPVLCDSSTKKFHYIPHYVQYPLQQPLLNLVYEYVIDGLKCFKKKSAKNMWNSFSHFSGYELLMLKKQLWYEQMASTPFSLKHFCRYSIRKCMDPLNLKHVKKLPLPEKLLSYLLFECEE